MVVPVAFRRVSDPSPRVEPHSSTTFACTFFSTSFFHIVLKFCNDRRCSSEANCFVLRHFIHSDDFVVWNFNVDAEMVATRNMGIMIANDFMLTDG
jgi:hypothetical protein